MAYFFSSPPTSLSLLLILLSSLSHICLAFPETKREKETILILLLSLATLFLSLLSLMALYYLRCFRGVDRGSKDVENRKPRKTHVSESTISPDAGEISGKEVMIRRMTWNEVEKATKGFSTVVGEGGFSTVYSAALSGNERGAAKVMRSSERLNRVFRQELDVLMRVRHENIVKLVGYCDEKEEGVLVFELVPNGSLHDKLHGEGPALPWHRRTSIAYQLARALEHLHSRSDDPIIHADVKSSNILLDTHLNCKLCDFGFARTSASGKIRSSSLHPVMGSPGYVDPHYLRTGQISSKNDVFSFGVVILELLTGKEAFCIEKEQLLTRVVGEAIKDPARVPELVDGRMKGRFDVEEACVLAGIAANCLQHSPDMRPLMADVLKVILEKVPSATTVAGKFYREGGKGEGMER